MGGIRKTARKEFEFKKIPDKTIKINKILQKAVKCRRKTIRIIKKAERNNGIRKMFGETVEFIKKSGKSRLNSKNGAKCR